VLKVTTYHIYKWQGLLEGLLVDMYLLDYPSTKRVGISHLTPKESPPFPPYGYTIFTFEG
jgi:hypothetical protein